MLFLEANKIKRVEIEKKRNIYMDRGIYTQLILLVIRALSTTHKTKISETFIIYIYIAWSKSYKCLP